MGSPCNDWNACTVDDACDGVRPARNGGCVGTDLYTDACNNTQCPASNPNGVPCDDLNPCTINDVCDAQGNCRGTPEEGCDTFERTPINCACDGAGTRSIALLVPPSTPDSPSALRVRLMDLQSPNPPNAACCPPPNFSPYEAGPTCADPAGCVRWVGKPNTFLESQGNPGQGSFRGARLQCTPYYHDWVNEPVFRVVGAEIIPSSGYEAQNFSASCMGNETTCTDVSAPLQVMTGRYGDMVARFNPPDPSTQPDAIDVTQLVNKFKNVPGSPSKPIAQLQPNLPEFNADINALDIVAIVDAVKGFAYSFAGPCPCPSLVTCGPGAGSLACPGGVGTCTGSGLPGLGPGGTCVKTCSDTGEPCINNTHCPGGSCGNPACRDACGRCSP
jgi:hypothetical protein